MLRCAKRMRNKNSRHRPYMLSVLELQRELWHLKMACKVSHLGIKMSYSYSYKYRVDSINFSLQIEAWLNQKKIQKNNSVLMRNKNIDESQRKPTKSQSFQKTWLRDYMWLLALKSSRCSAIFVGNLKKQTPLHRKKGVKILEPVNSSKTQILKNMWMLFM